MDYLVEHVGTRQNGRERSLTGSLLTSSVGKQRSVRKQTSSEGDERGDEGTEREERNVPDSAVAEGDLFSRRVKKKNEGVPQTRDKEPLFVELVPETFQFMIDTRYGDRSAKMFMQKTRVAPNLGKKSGERAAGGCYHSSAQRCHLKD